MTKTIGILIASTALTLALGIPAWSAIQGGSPVQAVIDAGQNGARMILADSDSDEGGSSGEGYSVRRGGEHEGGEDEDCEEDDGSCGNVNNPAPAGSVAPPQNGLFNNGTAPKAKVN